MSVHSTRLVTGLRCPITFLYIMVSCTDLCMVCDINILKLFMFSHTLVCELYLSKRFRLNH